MKAFYRMCVSILLLFLVLFAVSNYIIGQMRNDAENHEYRVEISRLCRRIAAGEEPDLHSCKYVTDVRAYDGSSSFYSLSGTFAVQEVNGTLYRFDYLPGNSSYRIRVIVNGVLAVMLLMIAAMLFYIYRMLLIPFRKMNDLPKELAKGNLTAPLPEHQTRFFGQFVWGINMLRETLEQAKQRELEMQKEQQTLILSVSHDIKTPLSAIKLYAKALEKGLYPDEEKRRETAAKISSNVDQIEQFVSDLTRNASEDFMTVDVQNSEFYLGDLIESLREMYEEKFMIQQIPFEIADYRNCMLFGDAERAVEVMQNLLENVLKYCIGGKAQIRFATEEDCQLVTVTNTKCTLPESEAVHMFDSFWRGSNSSGRSGNGLGLFICRKLMQAMNGEIFAQITNGEMQVTAVFRRI